MDKERFEEYIKALRERYEAGELVDITFDREVIREDNGRTMVNMPGPNSWVTFKFAEEVELP